MSTFLDDALKLQQHGFRIFPLIAGTKDPLIDEYAERATLDPNTAKSWWHCPVMEVDMHHNIGISTMGFIGVDIDNKDGRDGDLEILRWELAGKALPDTFEQFTPSGGRHLVYRAAGRFANSRSKLANGIDIRGSGGYLVGSGSVIGDKSYFANWRPVADAPPWLVEACRETAPPPVTLSQAAAKVDLKYAYRRGEAFTKAQPGVRQGTRGGTAFAHACRLKDFGVSEYAAFEILTEWAERCEPPMPLEGVNSLIESVTNAYEYGKNRIGSAAPEVAFGDISQIEEEKKEPVSPMVTLNQEFAFVISGGSHHVLWETIDEDGKPVVLHLDEPTFHKKYASWTMLDGNSKMNPVTKIWMSSPLRRSYNGFCFRPGLDAPKGFYNLWRGFDYEPAEATDSFTDEAYQALESFKEHLLLNICNNNEYEAKWLTAYFAHLVQKPWQKPHTAIVFKGKKGVGKSALVDRMGGLIGRHYTAVADRRYLVGNFNSHLENCILINLEEAFWSGDKAADGILKNLVTGTHHQIEHKGQESYRIKNLTRVAIIGNEDWIVPASADERRFAVFNVGDARREDIPFFRQMQEGMEAGGYRLLLRYLLDTRLDVEINKAPVTKGLLDQKMESLGPVHQWWHDSVAAGELVGAGIRGWPKSVSKETVRLAFHSYCRGRQIRSRIPEERGFGRILAHCSPSVDGTAKVKEGDGWDNAYGLPPLDKAKSEFETFIGHKVEWE